MYKNVRYWSLVQSLTTLGKYICEVHILCNPVGGQDYSPVNSSITFSASKTLEQVSISTSSDGLLEQAESFRVQLTSDHDDTRVLLLPAQSKIIIADNNSELSDNFYELCL